ncbi:MAG: RidA family protein [Ignavibacterium sp.]|jgi:enamine deaminase RidA (YjgF/YER057c/UK114 family)|uniref:RidA family protein n=1 Tax=Ignavibacterium album TaxID=591197 RepID=A0A7V2ZL93_9BACT|nr:RidA family protein [Ignavibacterium album]MCA2004844.1 RidA family protein [Ignavibacterium sp.]MCX8106034.1 RidA family protein [Ignavibacterium album]
MIEEKIKQLGFELPEVAKPLAAYIPAKKIGNLVMTSGQVPVVKGEIKYTGRVGSDLSEEDGQKAAQICALNCLAAIKSVIGSLDNIEEIVKLTVFVSSSDGFTAQPKVANGASELLGKIFGENGLHVRSAVGVNQLPLNASVEIEMIVRIK